MSVQCLCDQFDYYSYFLQLFILLNLFKIFLILKQILLWETEISKSNCVTLLILFLDLYH